MGEWLPRFACPECGAEMSGVPRDGWVCAGCSVEFERRNGVFHFLTAARRTASEATVRQYREVRAREGYLGRPPQYFRALPCVPENDPHASEWRIRSESFEHLYQITLSPKRQAPRRVLDLGAGNGWLSHRLASFGHDVVALDRLADDDDGLGACRHYATQFVRVQADFDALPFAPGQFDLVVFNGSLHYAPDICATLASARRMLNETGVLAVMDSPMFRREEDGHAMVAAKLQRFRQEYGLSAIVHPNVGFLTPASLGVAAARLGLWGRFVRSRGTLRWRVAREVARVRLRRAPASFGVWIARPAHEGRR